MRRRAKREGDGVDGKGGEMEGRGSTEEECVMCYIFLDVKAGAPSSLTGPKLHCRGMKVYTHSCTPSPP